jgi:hypothetical protein
VNAPQAERYIYFEKRILSQNTKNLPFFPPMQSKMAHKGKNQADFLCKPCELFLDAITRVCYGFAWFYQAILNDI